MHFLLVLSLARGWPGILPIRNTKPLKHRCIEEAREVCADVLQATELRKVGSEELYKDLLLALVSLRPLLTPAELSWLKALTPAP